MKQSLMLLVVVFSVCGCQMRGQRPAVDPFMGRTRVPPPGTGCVSDRSADPYYRGSPRAMAPLKPLAALSDDAKETPNSVASGRRVIRVLQPRGKNKSTSDLATATSSRPPRRMKPPQRAIDIMDLPEAKRHASPTSTSDGFRLVSGTEAADDTSFGPVDDTAAESAKSGVSVSAASAKLPELSARSGYGFDQQYQWLRGKLEYSQIDRCWKLRYIPADGTTDKYGGSVVLSDAAALSGLERGDFVEVKGGIATTAKKGSYAPTYEVAKIERVSRD
jgi:hypothetical protein